MKRVRGWHLLDIAKLALLQCVCALLILTVCGANSKHGSDKNSQAPEVTKRRKNSEITPKTETQLFIQKLFDKYGHGGVMTFEGFEHLLESLGIGNVKIIDHDIYEHKKWDDFVEFHRDHNHTYVTEQEFTSGAGSSEHDHDTDGHGHDDLDHHHDHHSHTDGANTGSQHHQSPTGDGHDHPNDHSGHTSDHHGNMSEHNENDNAFDFRNHQRETDGQISDEVGTEMHHGDDDDDADMYHPDHNHSDHQHGEHDENEHLQDQLGLQPATELETDHPAGSGESEHMFNHLQKGEIHLPTKENAQSEPFTSDYNTIAHNETETRKRTSSRKQRRQRRKGRKKKKRLPPEEKLPSSPLDENFVTRRKRTTEMVFDNFGGLTLNRPKRVAALEEPLEQCMTPTQILSTYHIEYQAGITEREFLELCPAIIYQIDRHACTHSEYERRLGTQPDAGEDHHDHDHDHHDDHVHNVTMQSLPTLGFFSVEPKVWGYAVLSVLIISLVGLLSVAIVPVMQKVFYSHLIQFLVALAVGSLLGDALLHLIPHAMMTSEHDHEDHGEEGGGGDHDPINVWKGMTVLSGIYFFFIMERLMGIFSEWKKTRRKMSSSKRRRRNRQHIAPKTTTIEQAIGEKLSRYGTDFTSCEDILMTSVVSSQKVFPTEGSTLMDSSRDHEDDLILEEETPFTGHGHAGHDHGGHGHSHGGMDGKLPTTISAIAWMVIMGDGLHNFSDGIAIGAAFANSMTGGLSTSVAVFCHELPHELGDFAVLLKAGMSVKQALFYNIVSSILCFMGMVIGVAVGNINTASLWIFALAAGMFIYISLVDMLPEMTNLEAAVGGRCSALFLHIIGMSVGVTIMLLIALYEDQIKIG